ncbi:MAG: hypothetical protein ACSLE9_07775 [Burkholderiaceae bacterium]
MLAEQTRPDQWADCDWKHTYARYSEAKRAAAALRRQSGARVHAFQCEDCGLYHTGHDTPPRRIEG